MGTPVHSSLSARAMTMINTDRQKSFRRTSNFSEQELNNLVTVRQVKTEIQILNKRIAELQQSNTPNLDQLLHLGQLLNERQSVLAGLPKG